MKLAKRHHRRHNAPVQHGLHSVPVFWRRVEGIYGADHRAFDAKHPDLPLAVEGYKQRLAKLKVAMGAQAQPA